MKCAICRKEFTPNPNARRKPKYCSGACKQKAYELRKKIGAKPVNVGGRTPEMVLGDGFEYAGSDIPMNRRHDFDRLAARKMDDDTETVLRRSQRKLQQVIDDPETPANAVAKLTETLISVTKELDALKEDAGGDDLLALLAKPDDSEVDDDVGAEII